MTFNVLTLFPGIFAGLLKETMLKRAIEAGVVTVNLVNIRDYATDTHQTTDDTPYGGGPGMVLKIEPIYRALEALGQIRNSKSEIRIKSEARMSKARNARVVLLAARGRTFDQKKARAYAKLDQLTLICGRYEGVDQRVADHLCDEELSIGPYVLSGGEIAAMAVVEATARLLPGFLGNPESLREESFVTRPQPLAPSASVEYPQFTKPAVFRGWKVPEVLLSGDHQKIAEWRKKHAHTV